MRDGRGALDALAAWLRSRYGGRARARRRPPRGPRRGGVRRLRPSSRREVLEELRALVPLAPLHQPYNLAAIEAVSERLPGVPQVACFDTSFHRGQPAVAELVPLPREIRRSGLQRYGFHGLSYEYIASVLPEVAPEIAARARDRRPPRKRRERVRAARTARASTTASASRRLDGLCMGTRPGALDPGVVLYLFQGLGLIAPRRWRRSSTRSRACWASRASATTCATSSTATSPARGWRSTTSCTAPRREIGAWPPCSEGSTGSSSPPASARTPPRSGAGSARRAAWLGVELDPEANARKGPRISKAGEQGLGVGDPDQRGADDRPTHRAAAGADRGPRLAGRNEEQPMATTAPQDDEGRRRSELPLARIPVGSLAEADRRPGLHPAELRAVRGRRALPGAGHAAHARGSGTGSTSCSSRSGRRACSTSPRSRARSRRTPPATSTARTRSSSASRPRRRSSARSCRTAASGWSWARSRPTATSPTRTSSRRSRSTARPTTRRCSTPTPRTSGGAAARTSSPGCPTPTAAAASSATTGASHSTASTG